MPTLVCHNGPQLLLRHHLDQCRCDGDGRLGVSEGIGIGQRAHLKEVFRLPYLQLFAAGRQYVIEMRQLCGRESYLGGHVHAGLQLLGTYVHGFLQHFGEQGDGFQGLQRCCILGMYEFGVLHRLGFCVLICNGLLIFANISKIFLSCSCFGSKNHVRMPLWHNSLPCVALCSL